MRWLEHIYHPFVAYLPIVGDILFRPWHFVRKVVERDDKFAKRLRGCSFFLASVYLIIQPYLLPKEVSAEPEGLVGHFKDDILMLALIAIFIDSRARSRPVPKLAAYIVDIDIDDEGLANRK